MNEKITYDTWDTQTQEKIKNKYNDFMDVLKWAYTVYDDKIVYACSFGAEGIVLIDLISKINPKATIIFLDTNLHFEETYDLIDNVKNKYPNLHIKLVEPKLSLEQQEEKYGEKLWEKDPNLCCYLRKIEPLKEELSKVDAWISGLRREQSLERSKTEYINLDHKFNSVKICPLIHWTWEDIWEYIRINNLEYNPLHDQNYPSIGCSMCTVPVLTGKDSRAGRWAKFEKKECGLHQT